MKLTTIKERYCFDTVHIETDRNDNIQGIRYSFKLGALSSDVFRLDITTKPWGAMITMKNIHRNNYTGLAMKEFTAAMWEDVYQKSKPGSIALFALPKSGTSRQAELMIVDNADKLAELDKAGGEPSFYGNEDYQGGKKI